MEPPYNIPAMAEIEPAMLDLAEKMKAKLISGEYDYIISDDRSGRIPSLIFKKIMEDLHPDKKISILHIAAGYRLTWVLRAISRSVKERSKPDYKQAEPDYKQILAALNKHVKPAVKNKALIVTEYIHSGESVKALKYVLHQAGLKFDIAAVNALEKEDIKEPGVEFFYSNQYIGSENPLLANAQDYAGVEKGEEYLAHPELWSKVMRHKGKTFTPEQEAKLNQAYQLTSEEAGEYFQDNEERRKEIRAGRDKRWSEVYARIEAESKKISPEDLKLLRQRIKQTREDIKTMAQKIAAKLKVK